MEFDNYKFRCSSLAYIMGTCKDSITKAQLDQIGKLEAKEELTTKQKGELTRLKKKRDNPPAFDLTKGAKTHLRNIVKGLVLSYKKTISSRAMDKGTVCEDDSITLYNEVYFTNYVKNEESRENEWIRGTCDVRDFGVKIQDYKTSKDKSTFPMLPDEIEIGPYEWQGRGYLMLYDEPLFELVYCLVQTPDELISDWDDYELHDVEDIEPEFRVTMLQFERDMEQEQLIKHKVTESRKYMNWYYGEILKKHG